MAPTGLVHEPLVQSVQFIGLQPDISKAPTHRLTNDDVGQQSRQTPLQYSVVSFRVRRQLQAGSEVARALSGLDALSREASDVLQGMPPSLR